ncbi:MAG: 4Fe-4S dicluster domain-containing protein [Spirochaetales bacterium]|nr:MAG: 4Fe-4S dicluster domain-containing protein [Spirochaetales bacterium]
MELRYFSAGKSLALDTGSCIGCGRCVEVCPHAVFSINDRLAAIEVRDRCMECGACGRNCPTGAITVKSGVGCAFAIINGMVSGKEPSCDCDGPESPRKNRKACC